uniref:AT-rich interactive domain-containing protein 2 n=1 Tax=Ananas comosus var. bracteatus TaxID=296719 RepID=A0A6V7QL47_ANACO|nr:unnamed protein product [Ananas comosus var. bracteatus]
MAGCGAPPPPHLPPPPTLDVAEILCKLQSVGFCSDLPAPAIAELGFFDRVLSAFLKEIYRSGEIRPLPAMLGDGRHVNLLELYSAVRERGGYESVSAHRLWAPVAEAIGFDSRVSSSLKLIYAKYLGALDWWFHGVFERNCSLSNLEEVTKGAKTGDSDQKKKVCKPSPPSGLKKDQFLTPPRDSRKKLQLDNGGGDNGLVVVLEKAVVNGGSSLLKRKRDVFVGVVNWLRNIAKNPSFTKLHSSSSDGAKNIPHVGGEHFSLALQLREAMFIKRIRNENPNGSLGKKGQKICPSMYDCTTSTNPQTKEKTRYSQRLQSMGEQPNLGNCAEISAPDTEIKGKSTDTSHLLSKDQQERDMIPVGRRFQAEVPEWTGKPVISDDPETLKWLGTRIWPLENEEKRESFNNDGPIGEGRKDNCGCDKPGLVDCVRFHIAEKRLQLKRELGSAFYSWGFHKMGEEVALSWTEEEERKFKSLVSLNPPSLDKNYWDHLYINFPSKGRKNLVSYYFNVFLLWRRSYQNRVTPNNIDSDDEESEFGFLSNPFGHDAIKFRDPACLTCSQNTQCMDIDD